MKSRECTARVQPYHGPERALNRSSKPAGNLWLAGWWLVALLAAAALVLPLGLASSVLLVAYLATLK